MIQKRLIHDTWGTDTVSLKSLIIQGDCYYVLIKYKLMLHGDSIFK